MSSLKTELKQPPWQNNAEGKIRRVGVELEMTGLDLDTLAKLVANFFKLEVTTDGRYERKLLGDPAGDWVVELDYALLKKLGHEELKNETLADKLNQSAEDVLALASEALVPLEIIGPPLPLDQLDEIEALISYLRDSGAKGSTDSAVNAFGMQFNPELASHDARHITACLKAFICMYDWLFKRADIDLTRRITSYVDPYPDAYIKKVIAADYWPDLTTLIDDYLNDNPTRNRALDMLPLFKFLDEQRVVSKADDTLIKARPTFHYRLPDCQIDIVEWGLYVAWNDWVEVERLAADEERLQACCEAYETHLNSLLKRVFSIWSEELEANWLNQ